jgi:hypothetical protein
MHRAHVFRLLALCAALSAQSCSSSAPTPTPTVFSPACLHYASHLTGGQCGAPALPAAEVARVAPRWAQHCEDVLAMPGSSLTAEALNQCLTLLEAGDCWSANPPESCLSAGTLPANAACNQAGVQCQSGSCLGTIAQAPCGNCVPAVSLGQACDPAGNANLCVLGTSCASSVSNADAGGEGGGGDAEPPQSPVCTPVTLGALGAVCTQSADCATGLICDATALTCSKPPGMGASCSDPFGCAYPLVCNVTNTGGTTCQSPGSAGAPCLDDEFCARGLGCSTEGGTCGPITWRSAGQPCDGDLARCLVGDCPAVQVPVCPVVLVDGAACTAGDTTTTCDAGAICFGGKCVPNSRVICQ